MQPDATACRPLSRREAAEYLSISPLTLSRWAMRSKGPRYVRCGQVRGRALYEMRDLDAWLESRKIDPQNPPKDSTDGSLR
jgi:hypothetical protein